MGFIRKFTFASVAILIAFMLLVSVFCVKSRSSYLLGDVNGDGKVSIRDATLIQMYLASFAEALEFMSEDNLICADVNEDGSVNILDATMIQKYRVGMDTHTRIDSYIERETEPVTTQPVTDGQWLPGYFD